MSRRILFFQSKVALAIIGTVLIGGGAALMASASFSATPNQSSTNQSQNYVNVSTNADGTATSVSDTTPSPTSTVGKSPSATPTPRAPTPTPTPRSGQAGTINGTVTSVNTGANQFTVRMASGALKTVLVNAQTTFQGACTSLSGMQTGWSAEVQGVYQGSFFLAKDVNSSLDD